MLNKAFKIISVFVLLIGLLLIMIIKNISVQKHNYLTELELTLRDEEHKNQFYKIKWEQMISPINLKRISEMILTNDYSKYFIVLNEEDLTQDKELYQDVINVVKPQRIINSSR